MTNQPKYKPLFYRIYRRVSTSMIVTVEDALQLGKVRITLTKYEKGKGATATVEHYLDASRAALLAWDLLNTPNAANTARGDVSLWWNGYSEFKGTRKNGDLEARTFQIELATQSDNPVRLTICNGPGEPVGTTGAIKPKKDANQTRVSTVLPWLAIREMALAIVMHIQSWAAMTYYERRDRDTWQPDQEPTDQEESTAILDTATGEIRPRRAIPPNRDE